MGLLLKLVVFATFVALFNCAPLEDDKESSTSGKQPLPATLTQNHSTESDEDQDDIKHVYRRQASTDDIKGPLPPKPEPYGPLVQPRPAPVPGPQQTRPQPLPATLGVNEPAGRRVRDVEHPVAQTRPAPLPASLGDSEQNESAKKATDDVESTSSASTAEEHAD